MAPGDRQLPPRARGKCPRCGRVITGAKAGNGYVALSPHTTGKGRRPAWCLARPGRRVVPRLPDDTPVT